MAEWDAIPYDQLVWGEKLGQGSFGVVMKGSTGRLPLPSVIRSS